MCTLLGSSETRDCPISSLTPGAMIPLPVFHKEEDVLELTVYGLVG